MLKSGILNPHILGLLARIRHTNTLVIADRGFPFWPTVETIDLSLVDDIPTVLQVFRAVQKNFVVGRIHMAEEFRAHNPGRVQAEFEHAFGDLPVSFEHHEDVFKKRLPAAGGLIRTADTVPYANLILVSA